MKDVLRPLGRFAFCAVAASFWALPACVDTSPIDYHAAATNDAGVADSAPVSSDAAHLADCRQCITSQDGCSAEYEKCAANPRCATFFGCLLDSYCLNIPSDLSKLPPCLTVCGTKANLFSSDDPLVPLYVAVLYCTEDKCKDPCGIQR